MRASTQPLAYAGGIYLQGDTLSDYCFQYFVDYRAVAAHVDLVTAHVAADEAQRESQVRQRAEPAPLGKTKFLIVILVKAAVPVLVAVGNAIKARVSAGAVRGA